MSTAFGARLEAARASHGDRQVDAGAYFGVTQPTWARWASGDVTPDDRHLGALARYLDTSIDDVWLALHGPPSTVQDELVEMATEAHELRRQLGHGSGVSP